MPSVAFYGRLAEVAWRGSRSIDVPDEVTTIGDLRAWLPTVAPALAGELGTDRVRAALGDQFAEDGAALAHDSEIAFLPPVSGG